MKFSQCDLVVLGGGPPCQGVSGLNSDRKGALKDQRSNLFVHLPRIESLLQRHFRWCPVHTLMESVSSMDSSDRNIMSQGIGRDPVHCDAGVLTWCHRPRLYWCSWELLEGEGAALDHSPLGPPHLLLTAHVPISDFVQPGWLKVDPDSSFPTFTTSRPRASPGRKPAGISQCNQAELQRWREDLHRFPPYQYLEKHCLVNKHNELRLPSISERELMMGFPLGYTAPCSTKAHRQSVDTADKRLSLLGNSWSVPVVAWLLGQLLTQLGICDPVSPQEIMDRCRPGGSSTVLGRLCRLPLQPARPSSGDPVLLARALSNLVTMKGEDLLISAPSSQLVRHHRLRATVPAKLWTWKTIAGWRWRHGSEHINALELRAILTSIRWRVEHCQHVGCRILHLTDSLVSLHALTRGMGRAQACDTLAGLQNQQPNLKGQLQGAWRLLKAWHQNELPSRAPPFPEHVVQALAGWAFFQGHYSFGVSVLVGFYCMLRTGEVLQLRASNILVSSTERTALLSLGLTKTGKRQGAAESVVVTHEPTFFLLKRWKDVAGAAAPLTPSPGKWRALFNQGLEALQVTSFEFRPYSLRRGGATWWFGKHQNMDRILVQGRWQTQKSARVYLNEGLAVLAQMRLPRTDPTLRSFLTVFSNTSRLCNFSKLEPPASTGSPGGRGKKRQNKGRRARKARFNLPCFPL
eukprot:Skav213597  [mRNA]  locus=scaffold77:213673:216130:- [translate_table: standard]